MLNHVTICYRLQKNCVCKPKSSTTINLKTANRTPRAPSRKVVLVCYFWEDDLDRNTVNSEMGFNRPLRVSKCLSSSAPDMSPVQRTVSWQQCTHSLLPFLAVWGMKGKQWPCAAAFWWCDPRVISLHFGFFVSYFNFLTSQNFGSASWGHVFRSASKWFRRFLPTGKTFFVCLFYLKNNLILNWHSPLKSE